MLSELARIHETRVGELAIASGETKMSRDTALEKKSVKARKLENENQHAPRGHTTAVIARTHKKREHCIVSAPGKETRMQNFDLDVVRPATAPGVEVIFLRASSSPALEAVMGMEDGEFVTWLALISEYEMMVATEGCIASGKADAAETSLGGFSCQKAFCQS